MTTICTNWRNITRSSICSFYAISQITAFLVYFFIISIKCDISPDAWRVILPYLPKYLDTLPTYHTCPEASPFCQHALRKHAYSNILKILPPKNENFQMKNSDIFHISAQNIDYGYSLEPPQRGGSNEYPQSMFWAEIRKIMYTPSKPQFYYIKVGFQGVKII